MIRGLEKLTHEERLMRCGRINKFGKYKKKRSPNIEAYRCLYNIMIGKDAISAHKFFEISLESKTRGHRYNKIGLCKTM